jgi:GMP synthase PP-ATPase subunit
MAIKMLTGGMDEAMVEPLLKLVEDEIRSMNPNLKRVQPR